MKLVQDVLVDHGACTLQSHDELKRHPHAFYSQCQFVGIQVGMEEDGEGTLMELWTHVACGSTVAIPCPLSLAPDELMVLADKHVALVRVGTVLEAAELDGCAPFVVHIPAALSKRGMHIEAVPGGWLVCRSPAR